MIEVLAGYGYNKIMTPLLLIVGVYVACAVASVVGGVVAVLHR
jgi:hypothetical protein